MNPVATRVAAVTVLLLTWAAVGIGFGAGSGRIPMAVGCGLVVAAIWAPSAWATWRRQSNPLVSISTLLAASGLAASRFALGGHRVATALAAATAAVILHWLLALPGNRLGGRGLRAVVVTTYGAAVGGSAVLLTASHPFNPSVAGGVAAALGLVSGPALRSRYRAARSPDRDRMRWLASGVVATADIIVVALTLHVIVKWPQGLLAVVVAAAVVPALALAAAESRPLAGVAGRILVDVLSMTGFVALTVAVYLVVVFGLGRAPDGTGDRETLALSMVAAAIAAVSYRPARRRLLVSVNLAVFGARQAPDDLVEAFGSRLTRAMPMDELLLQLAESLVRSLELIRADIYTGSGEVLERAAGVPDTGAPRSLVITARERPAVVRASVSGNAWIEVWLPGLARPDRDAQLRAAPIRNAGALFGLIVVERAAAADPFSEDDERVLADLARQVGLALHNMQLDAALQQSLAELRNQAAELRESRARIVASGDAERRRVERDLHDGAQQNLVALAIGLRLPGTLLPATLRRRAACSTR